MTSLGEYLSKRFVNRAGVARKTGLSKTRLHELCNNSKTNLKASELYLIALAIGADPCELLHFVCGHLKLEESA